MSENLAYGRYGQPYVGEASVDELNVASVEIHVPYRDPVDYSFLNIRKAPSDFVPLPCKGVKLLRKLGFHEIVYSFAGNTDPTSFDTAPSEIVYELEGADQDSPIETHPQFLLLVTKYGGTYNPDGTFAGFPRFRQGGKPGEKSPLYGVDAFEDINYVWTKSYTSGAFPVQALQNVGCIDTPDFGPDGPAYLAETRQFLKIAPRISKRGNVWGATERWREGGRNGVNRDVYRVANS